MNLDPSSDDIYMPHLEKNYFSNFVCCGLQLVDFHELVAHFEEYHVTVHGTQALSAEPMSPETSASSTLESPQSPYSPTPTPPNLFPTLTAAFTPPESVFPPVHVKSDHSTTYTYHHDPPSTDLRYYASSQTCGGSLPILSSSQVPLSIQPQACVPSPQYISVTPLRSPCVAPSHVMMEYPDPPSNAVTPPTIAPTPVYARHPNLSIITDLPRDPSEPTDVQTGDNSVSCNAESEGDDRLPAARRRKKVHTGRAPAREKMYKCPHPGCIKSYLNPNGLKYHLTKGACEIASSS